jgi:hypothetical protein
VGPLSNGLKWPIGDEQVSRLTVHCTHLAKIRRAESTVANAADAIVERARLIVP